MTRFIPTPRLINQDGRPEPLGASSDPACNNCGRAKRQTHLPTSKPNPLASRFPKEADSKLHMDNIPGRNRTNTTSRMAYSRAYKDQGRDRQDRRRNSNPSRLPTTNLIYRYDERAASHHAANWLNRSRGHCHANCLAVEDLCSHIDAARPSQELYRDESHSTP